MSECNGAGGVIEMDILQLYNHFAFLILSASLLAVLGLRGVTGSASAQVTMIRDFRTLAERADRNCLLERTTELELDLDASSTHSAGNVLAFPSDRSGRRFVSASDRFIRTLAVITKDRCDLSVWCLQPRLGELKRLDANCQRLRSALEVGRIQLATKEPILPERCANHGPERLPADGIGGVRLWFHLMQW